MMVLSLPKTNLWNNVKSHDNLNLLKIKYKIYIYIFVSPFNAYCMLNIFVACIVYNDFSVILICFTHFY